MSDWAGRMGVSSPDPSPPRRITVQVTLAKRKRTLQVLADDTGGQRAWAGGGGPAEIVLDIGATLVAAHSDKEGAAPSPTSAATASIPCSATWRPPARRWPGCAPRKRGGQHRRRSHRRLGGRARSVA